QDLTLLGGRGVVEDRWHLRYFRNRRLLRAQEKDELAVADELLVDAKLTVRGASPVNLAALHGKDRVGRALVARDDAELGAEHVIEDGRQDVQRRAGACAPHDELLGEQIRRGSDRGRVPTRAHGGGK